MKFIKSCFIIGIVYLALPMFAMADGGPVHGAGTGSLGGYQYTEPANTSNYTGTQAVLQNYNQSQNQNYAYSYSGQYSGTTGATPAYYGGQTVYGGTQTAAGTGVNQYSPYSGVQTVANTAYPSYYANPVTGQPFVNPALTNAWTLNLPIQQLVPRAASLAQTVFPYPRVVGFENYYSVSLANTLPSYYGGALADGVYTIYGGERYEADTNTTNSSRTNSANNTNTRNSTNSTRTSDTRNSNFSAYDPAFSRNTESAYGNSTGSTGNTTVRRPQSRSSNASAYGSF